MKKTIIIAFLVALASPGFSQVLGSIFNQNGAYKKNLLLQLTALQTYKGYLQKGYKIAKKGLNTIQQFKGGEFDLHRFYFDSLKLVNPKIRRYSKVAEIMTMEAQVVLCCSRAKKQARGSHQFGDNELDYFDQVFSALLQASEHTIDELNALCTDRELQMRDDERLARIDLLWQEITRQFTYLRSFIADLAAQAAQRIQDKTRLEGVAAYYQKD